MPDVLTQLVAAVEQLAARVRHLEAAEILHNATQLQGVGVDSGSPSDRDLLRYDGSEWTPTAFTANESDTISSGSITLSSDADFVSLTVDTESAAANDDLDTIDGGHLNQLLSVRSSSSTRTVTLKDGTGNLLLSGDFALDNARDTILLQKSSFSAGGGTAWKELSRSDNA